MAEENCLNRLAEGRLCGYVLTDALAKVILPFFYDYSCMPDTVKLLSKQSHAHLFGQSITQIINIQAHFSLHILLWAQSLDQLFGLFVLSLAF